MSEKSESENRGQGYRWHAAIARDLAEQCRSEGARTALQDMARRYERLAAWAERDGAAATPGLVGRAGPALPAPRSAGTWHIQ